MDLSSPTTNGQMREGTATPELTYLLMFGLAAMRYENDGPRQSKIPTSASQKNCS